MKMIRCVLCGDYSNIEHPELIQELNPKSLRLAWMHTYCYKVALEELKDLPATNIKYENKLDEYYAKVADK